MRPSRNTPFVSLNLTTAARDELRRVTLELTTPAGRRLSMSDALVCALKVAMRHREETLSMLKGNQ